MSMYLTEKKVKRTKREQLLLIENMNRDAIEKLMAQQINLAEQIQELLKVILNAQKILLVLQETLKQKRVVSDIELQTIAGAIDDFKEMEAKALIIDPNRKDTKDGG